MFEADNGETGLEMAIEHSPQLAIIDIDIPNINGFMLSELLKEHDETVDIPVVLMTGMAQHAYAWKFDEEIVYLEKPFDDVALLTAVKQQLFVTPHTNT